MYTNVPKPTGTNYTNVNTYLPTYDNATILYDDPSTRYDGVDSYNNVSKPTGTGYTNIPKPT